MPISNIDGNINSLSFKYAKIFSPSIRLNLDMGYMEYETTVSIRIPFYVFEIISFFTFFTRINKLSHEIRSKVK